MEMLKKLPKIGKNEIFTAFVIFAAVFSKALYEMSRLGTLQVETIVRAFLAGVAMMVFIVVGFSKSFGKSLTGQDLVGVLALFYTLGFTVSLEIIRFDIFTYLVCISVILLLVKNIYALIAAAALSIFLTVFINYAAVVCIPAAIGASMVAFAPDFAKVKNTSKKKSKKATQPQDDNKKDKIIFFVCQAVMLISLVYADSVRRFSMALISFKYNIKLIIPILILCALLIALAVFAIKKKRPAIEIAGYILPVLFSIMPVFMEYTIVSTHASALFCMLFVMCSEGSLVGEIVEAIRDKAAAAISEAIKKAET